MLSVFPPDFLTDPDEVGEFLTDVVDETFQTENTRRQEHRDPTALTMSGLGGCTRRNAYALAGVPASDVHPPEQARQALLGVGVHDWFLPAMARVIARRLGIGVDVEKQVVLHAAGVQITGQLDVAFLHLVGDLKTAREYRLDGVRRRNHAGAGAYSEHHVQVGGYGLAERQAGRDVEWIAFLYMDRSTGDVLPLVEPFTNAYALAVIDRVETIYRFALAGPDTAPREARGPGVSLACDRCSWLRRCWGPDAKPGEPGPQTQLADSPAGLLEILALAFAASGVTSGAKADRDFAKLVLSRTNDGQYGPYALRRSNDTDEVDSAAMQQILTELGIEIPRKARAGSMYVKLAKPPKGQK